MTSPVRAAGLAWGQQWSWHEQQADPVERTPTLLLSRVLDLPESAGLPDILDAVRLAVGRHEVLRSTFAPGPDGAPHQYVWPAEAQAYQLEDFTREADCLAWLRRPMDLAAGWPLRVGVLRPDGGPTRLGVATHHIATDLYGFDVLCQELRVAVRAGAEAATQRLPAVGRHPVDLATFERSPAGVAVNERAIGYWLRHDDDLGEVLGLLRARYERPSDTVYVARVVCRRGRRLAELAGTGRSSEPAVAVAAVACALAGHLDRARIPLTMLVANRHLQGLRHSVSCVAQSGLASVAVPDPGNLASAVPSAWAGTLSAMRHAYFDSDELSERLKSVDSGGRHTTVAPPSINIVRAGVTQPGLILVPRPDLSDDRFTAWSGQREQRCLGLHFHVQLSADVLSVELRAGAHLVSAEQCHRLAADALTLLCE